MGLIYINKFELKAGAMREFKSGDEEDQIEKAVNEDIVSVKNILIQEKKRQYNESEKTEMLLSILKRNNTWKKKYGENIPNLKEIFPNIYEKDLYKWRVQGEVEFDERPHGIELRAGFHTDFFEVNEFRDEFSATPDTKFGSFKMTTGSPLGLIFLYTPYGVDGRFRRAIKMMLPSRNNVRSVRWNNNGLRSIYAEDGDHLLGLNVSGIEGDIKASVTSTSLDQKQLYERLEKGSFNGIAYRSKKYPGNSVRINGGAGYIYTDLEDNVVIQYFKEILMRHADF